MLPIKQTYRGKACVECRQQKLRCDANQDYTKPCSRCQKTGIDCSIPDSFQRRKRQSKAAMQREIDKLRKQTELMEYREAENEPSVPIAAENTTSMQLSSPPTFTLPLASAPETLEHSPSNPSDLSNLRIHCSSTRSIDGMELEERKINDCFDLFFKHYYSYVPIVEPGQAPSQYYLYSPLLFWTIVAIGCRRYRDDPTILHGLAPRLSALVLQSLGKPYQHIQTIQSLLLLCTWPFPSETIHNDPSLLYSGAVMQLALQNGLHMFSKRQDFTRAKLGRDEIQETFTARLWSCCKIVCHGTSFCSGLQPYVVSDAFEIEQQRQDLITLLPPSVYWTQKLHQVTSHAISTLMHDVFVISQERTRSAVGSLIDVFDDQVLETSRRAACEISTLRILYSRLHIRAFHFFEVLDAPKYTKLIELYHIACSFIETISTLDAAEDFALYTTEMIYRTLTLAACTILRIFRCDLRLRTDLSAGERCFFAAIHILRKRSLQNNDVSSRSAIMLTQLWQSKQVFRQADATFNSLHVRIRSRGSMGVAYDCFWYWRHEFNGQADPYSELNNNKRQSDLSVIHNSLAATHEPWSMDNLGGEIQEVALADRIYLDDQNEANFFPSWEWPDENAFL